MNLHEKIKKEIKDAMKAKDSLRLSVLRNMLSSFVNEMITKKEKPDAILNDEGSLTVIKKLAKQRKDSIEQFKNGNREDLAEKEEVELKILEEYLPEMVSREEIEKIASTKKDELKIEDKAKMGILIGVIMKELKGNADGVVVKEVVESLF